MRKMRFRHIAFVLVVLLPSCQQEKSPASKTDSMAKIQAKLAKAEQDFYKERSIICRLDLLVSAEKHVDSLIAQKNLLTVLKNGPFPTKPLRPAYPYPIILDDTTVVKPILGR